MCEFVAERSSCVVRMKFSSWSHVVCALRRFGVILWVLVPIVHIKTIPTIFMFQKISSSFPNAHTHYFSCALLYLFAETPDEEVQEQITRVLLERLIVHRPHPWGLLITFIELIKNPKYLFWSHGFVR